MTGERVSHCREVVAGKVYDTETATLIGRRYGAYTSERLYRTQKGAHFLVEEHPSTTGGYPRLKNVSPTTRDRAVAWVGRCYQAEDILREYFALETEDA